MSKLKEEIAAMEKEHSDLQQHIGRTDWWCENLGHWRATLTAAEVTATAVSPAQKQSANQLEKPRTGERPSPAQYLDWRWIFTD